MPLAPVPTAAPNTHGVVVNSLGEDEYAVTLCLGPFSADVLSEYAEEDGAKTINAMCKMFIGDLSDLRACGLGLMTDLSKLKALGFRNISMIVCQYDWEIASHIVKSRLHPGLSQHAGK